MSPSSPTGKRLASLGCSLGVVTVCALALSACGEKAEPTGSSVKTYPVSVSDAGRNRVSLERAPRLIGIAGSAPAQIAVSISIPVVRVDDGSGNLEMGRLRKLRPELVLCGSEVGEAALDRARALGIAVYAVPDRSLDGIEKAMSDVGLLAGAPIRGRTARARIARVRGKVKTALAGAEPVRVFLNVGRFATVSSSSFIGSVIAEAGGENVAGPDPNEGPFPLERLVRLRPEVLVLASHLTLTRSSLRRSPLTRQLPAVRSDRIVHIDMRLLEPGPEAAVALERLARAFHPDAFR